MNAIVEIQTQRPVSLELYKDYKELGRFMLRYVGSTIAAGVVTEVKFTYNGDKQSAFFLCHDITPFLTADQMKTPQSSTLLHPDPGDDM